MHIKSNHHSFQTYAVGIMVPDPDVLPGWAKDKGFSGGYAELCSNPKVKEAVLADINKYGKDAGLKGFEQVSAWSELVEEIKG